MSAPCSGTPANAADPFLMPAERPDRSGAIVEAHQAQGFLSSCAALGAGQCPEAELDVAERGQVRRNLLRRTPGIVGDEGEPHASRPRAHERLGGEPLADRYWDDLNEQRLDFFDAGLPLWRLSLPATAPVLTLPEPA